MRTVAVKVPRARDTPGGKFGDVMEDAARSVSFDTRVFEYASCVCALAALVSFS
ncbi:MAG TPA: hypothetical protein VGO28_08010 [Acidimicrobiia bacterium]